MDPETTLKTWQEDLLQEVAEQECYHSEGRGAPEILVEKGYVDRNTWDPGEGKWVYEYRINSKGRLYLQRKDQLLIATNSVNAELIAFLSKHPKLLYEINPYKFEEIVAALLEDMGYSVHVTPSTKDGGRDILAVFKLPVGEILTVVDCKRYAPSRKIGPDIIRQLLWVSENTDRASRAMIATTTFFTAGARQLESEYRWKLGLSDFDQISSWLAKYGSWKSDQNSGVWTPPQLGNPTT